MGTEQAESGELVSLEQVRFEKRKARGPDVILTIELYCLDDGRVAYDAGVQEWVPTSGRQLSDRFIRSNLRWAILEYAKRWRMGLRRRAQGGRHGKAG